ncbi:hypothetical protein GCM10028862_19990 [Luteimonas pelagia]
MTALAGHGATLHDEAECILFGDVLACTELRPATFLPGTPPPAELQADLLRAETFLHALAVIEDRRGEDPDEHGPLALALDRIEARLDLLAMQLGQVLPGGGADPARRLRWSARGACLPVDAPLAPGTAGVLRVLPADALCQALRLPARVVACREDEAGALAAWVRFEGLTPGVESALERHLFRIHRRAVADRRRAR